MRQTASIVPSSRISIRKIVCTSKNAGPFGTRVFLGAYLVTMILQYLGRFWIASSPCLMRIMRIVMDQTIVCSFPEASCGFLPLFSG